MFPTACSCKPRSASRRASEAVSGEVPVDCSSAAISSSHQSSRSDSRANGPGRKLIRASIELLALRPFARSHLQNALEDALSGLLHRLVAIHDGPAVDVHVLLHALEEVRVGRDLDRGRRLAAENAAAARRKADEVRTPGNLSRRGYRIEPRRIHAHEAF